MYFCCFIIISPLKRAWPFIYTKMNPLHPKSLVEIGQVVLEKMIFKFCQCIVAIVLSFPLWKGHGPSFELIWIPFIKGYFKQSLVKIFPFVLEKLFLNFPNELPVSQYHYYLPFEWVWSFIWSPLGKGCGPSFE